MRNRRQDFLLSIPTYQRECLVISFLLVQPNRPSLVPANNTGIWNFGAFGRGSGAALGSCSTGLVYLCVCVGILLFHGSSGNLLYRETSVT